MLHYALLVFVYKTLFCTTAMTTVDGFSFEEMTPIQLLVDLISRVIQGV